MIRLTVKPIIFMHEKMIKKTGGSSGILNKGMLYSAVYAPFQGFGDKELYPSLEEKAARLAWFLVSDHP